MKEQTIADYQEDMSLMNSYSGQTSKGMKSVGLYTTDEVFSLMDEAEQERKPLTLGGVRINSKSHRLQLFRKKGVSCYKCGLRANFFSLEDQEAHPSTPHLNLYCLTEDRFVLFTRDHIIPRRYGGPDHLLNYETMCSPCNGKRGHDLPEKETALSIIAALNDAGYKFQKPITLPYL